MKLPETLFSRMTLAALPFLIYALDLEKTCQVALLTAGVTWLTLFFFWFARRLFPPRFLKEAFFLWLLVWGHAAWVLGGLAPLWILSVFFLAPLSFLEAGAPASRRAVFSKKLPHYLWERMVGGFAFVGFVLFLTWAQRAFGRWETGGFLNQQTTTFLMIAVLAIIWKLQPFRK